MNNAKRVFCPNCGACALHFNGIGMLPLSVKCKKCGSCVTYFPHNDTIKVEKEPPLRASSSGRRFY